MPDALLDLLLGSSCAVCDRPGRALCRACRHELPTAAVRCVPSPCPPGLAPAVVAGEYAGALKLLVNAHKEQGRFALAEPLGDLLAGAVLGHTGPAAARSGRRVLLVPVPSRASVVRRRGHDPLLRVTQRTCSRLRGEGVPATVARLLRTTRAVRDQAGLGAADRARNLARSMACTTRAATRAAGAGRPLVVVVDDVLTTGATVREAQRALEEAGLAVSGIAAVAATRRTRAREVTGQGRGAGPERGAGPDPPARGSGPAGPLGHGRGWSRGV